MAAVNTLKRGCIWRVGDVQKINIWDDAWLLGVQNRKVITPRGNQIISKVHDLINLGTGQWDEELVRQTFWQVDSKILDIPLPNYDMEDFLAWGMSKNFWFSVKSAYYVEWDHKFGNNLRWSNGQGAMQSVSVWKKVWDLDCPAKVRIFI